MPYCAACKKPIVRPGLCPPCREEASSSSRGAEDEITKRYIIQDDGKPVEAPNEEDDDPWAEYHKESDIPF